LVAMLCLLIIIIIIKVALISPLLFKTKINFKIKIWTRWCLLHPKETITILETISWINLHNRQETHLANHNNKWISNSHLLRNSIKWMLGLKCHLHLQHNNKLDSNKIIIMDLDNHLQLEEVCRHHLIIFNSNQMAQMTLQHNNQCLMLHNNSKCLCHQWETTTLHQANQ
jgi:hypothetical protein